MTGLIINPRGSSGAGKTEFARRIMAMYGTGDLERIHRPGRRDPICYRLRHPHGGRPLVVLGHYEVTSGGCDTIRSLDEVFGLATGHAAAGQDVLCEGFALSREFQRSAALARTHRLHVLHLRTPVEQCVRQLIRRRRPRREIQPMIAHKAAAQQDEVAAVCERLRPYAQVESLEFEAALERGRELLGLGGPAAWAGAARAAIRPIPAARLAAAPPPTPPFELR